MHLNAKRNSIKKIPFLNLDVRSPPIDQISHYLVMDSSASWSTYMDINCKNPFVCTDWKMPEDGKYVLCSQTLFHLDFNIHYRNSDARSVRGQGIASFFRANSRSWGACGKLLLTVSRKLMTLAHPHSNVFISAQVVCLLLHGQQNNRVPQ